MFDWHKTLDLGYDFRRQVWNKKTLQAFRQLSCGEIAPRSLDLCSTRMVADDRDDMVRQDPKASQDDVSKAPKSS